MLRQRNFSYPYSFRIINLQFNENERKSISFFSKQQFHSFLTSHQTEKHHDLHKATLLWPLSLVVKRGFLSFFPFKQQVLSQQVLIPTERSCKRTNLIKSYLLSHNFLEPWFFLKISAKIKINWFSWQWNQKSYLQCCYCCCCITSGNLPQRVIQQHQQ